MFLKFVLVSESTYRLFYDLQIQQEKRESEARVRQLESEARQLNEKLKTMEEIQSVADQQLVEADEERERLLTALQDLESEVQSSL